ncbi:hypothetical protein Sru01_25650 [Sphaerisporangium rufum]|uniref:Uncharacterized protein n=1 Tax=Sphaerisporangium rufum TaxID=1381558 RepID=A0A919R1F5_9ACTN|nr:DUF6461 domain-containing protein [Sphaerisporangium rufum]GII77583.1 hypothetical protein Sru01_25650 [Sphaerisporangium rufum]
MQSRSHLHDLLVATIFTEGLDAEVDEMDEKDLWTLGFSAVWIKGAGIDALAPAFSLDLITRTPCYLSELLERHYDDESLWVAEVNGWIGIVPARDDDAFLLSITEAGREALSLSMGITGHDYFKYARDGRMVVSFEPTCPELRFGDDPHALDHLMDGLRFQISEFGGPDAVEPDESISSALALIGRITETDIATDWFQARHSRIRPTS